MLSCWITLCLVSTIAEVTTPAELEQRLDTVLASPALVGSQVGVLVMRLPDHQVLFARQSRDLMIPASNVKVITTSAALNFLGPDFRFKTEVRAEADANGVVSGNLWLKGFGDPYLIPERLWYLANRVAFSGITEVQGDLVADDSFFDGPNMEEGWEQDKSSASYMAPTGALSLGFNAVLVHVFPAKIAGEPALVMVEPKSPYAPVIGTIMTTERGRPKISVEVFPKRERSEVRVSGRVRPGDSPRGFWRRIDNPVLFTGDVFKDLLAKVGVVVHGNVIRGQVPAQATLVATLPSPRLAELVQHVNKHSNNFMAAQIARVLGAEVFGPPGNWEKGKNAIEMFLEREVGLAPNTYTLGNASGLHDVNRLSPSQIVQVLTTMYEKPNLRPEFEVSLAVAGGSGTLAERMIETDAQQILRAKTGTLSLASALSGFVTCRSGETLVFSFIVNNFKTPLTDIWDVQDIMGEILAQMDFRPKAEGTMALGVKAPELESPPP